MTATSLLYTIRHFSTVVRLCPYRRSNLTLCGWALWELPYGSRLKTINSLCEKTISFNSLLPMKCLFCNWNSCLGLTSLSWRLQRTKNVSVVSWKHCNMQISPRRKVHSERKKSNQILFYLIEFLVSNWKFGFGLVPYNNAYKEQEKISLLLCKPYRMGADRSENIQSESFQMKLGTNLSRSINSHMVTVAVNKYYVFSLSLTVRRPRYTVWPFQIFV